MLSLSQTTGYVVLALSRLNPPGGTPVRVAHIAELTGIPQPYLQKVMHRLATRGLVTTVRGRSGGLLLGRDPRKISLMQVAEAVEGRQWLPACILGLEDCSDLRCCPTHEFWKVERAKIEEELRGTVLSDVIDFERVRGGAKLKTRWKPPVADPLVRAVTPKARRKTARKEC